MPIAAGGLVGSSDLIILNIFNKLMPGAVCCLLFGATSATVREGDSHFFLYSEVNCGK